MSGGATEWEDLLIQHGIIKAPNNESDKPAEIVYDLEDKENDSDIDDLDDADFLTSYK